MNTPILKIKSFSNTKTDDLWIYNSTTNLFYLKNTTHSKTIEQCMNCVATGHFMIFEFQYL